MRASSFAWAEGIEYVRADVYDEAVADRDRAVEALRLAYPYVKDLAKETPPGPVRHIIEDDVAVIGKTLAALAGENKPA